MVLNHDEDPLFKSMQRSTNEYEYGKSGLPGQVFETLQSVLSSTQSGQADKSLENDIKCNVETEMGFCCDAEFVSNSNLQVQNLESSQDNHK